jgi:hypothetical protein
MNTSVQAGVLTTSVSATMSNATVIATVRFESTQIPPLQEATCLPLSIISLNGHSLSAINPDFAKGGELATLIAA